MYDLLIIDDEYQSRNTLSTCFPWQSIGFNVAGQACNGLEALKFLKSNIVHVILCDIRMPVISGIELAKQLFNKNDSPVVVFLSGYRDFEYARQAIMYGVRFYIIKPARYEELYETFNTIKTELDFINKTESTDSELLVPQQDLILQKLKDYIERNYRTANLKDAAKMIYMNSCYISQIFKQKTGQNFSYYLLVIRMKNAERLLRNPSYKIYQISNLIGYANPKNFARTFKNYFKISPKEYRDQLHMHVKEEDNIYED